MRLNNESLEYLQPIIKIAKLVNINSIVIEPDRVRAMDENKTVVLFQDENVPEISSKSIGLYRIDVFNSRFEIIKSQEKFYVEAMDDTEKQHIPLLVMKAKGMKIEFKCMNPLLIKAPKAINDVMVARFPVNEELVSLMQKGITAMGSEMIEIIGEGTLGSFELSDVKTGDVFNYEFTKEVEALEEGDSSNVRNKYPLKTLLTLFKQNPESYFEIGQKGILGFSVENLKVYVLPRV